MKFSPERDRLWTGGQAGSFLVVLSQICKFGLPKGGSCDDEDDALLVNESRVLCVGPIDQAIDSTIGEHTVTGQYGTA